MRIENRHERTIEAQIDVVAPLIDGLGRDGDRLWPAPAWVPMRLDRPVAVGAAGGHGPVRYRVVAHDPGRRVRFEFLPGLGLAGHHEFSVEPDGEKRCRLRHVIEGSTSGSMRLLWPVAVRPLHDAVVEDALDNAERLCTGRIARPARWSRWVRFLRRYVEHPRPRPVPVPEAAQLLRGVPWPADLRDAWQVPLVAGVTSDPSQWADAVFRDPPRWVVAALRLRNALVGLVGIERGDPSAFATIERTDTEVLLGSDAGHLDFRASILVEPRAVTLTTVVRTHNFRGRLYMFPVWRIHGMVVRSMLYRALRRLSESAGTSAGALGTASDTG